MALAAFKYTALADPNNEIRLLELQPGSGRVQCRLKDVKLHENTVPYEPLSYCWGDQTDKVSVLVNDAPFKISTNLHNALRRLRLKSQARTIWVDAICINQDEDHTEEKSSQILLMKRIFQGGERTIVWLGEHDSETALAFEIIECLSQYVEENPDTEVYSVRWQEYQRLMLGKGMIPSHPFGRIWNRWQRIKAVSAIFSVFDRSWFSRVWVIQELAVSRDVLFMCGIHYIELDVVEQAHEACIDKWSMDDHVGMLLDQRRIYQLGIPQEPANLILSAARSKATDPRDRIYGMLGLLSRLEDDSMDIDIDYSIDAQDLFMDLTRRLLQGTKDAGLLSAAIGCEDMKMKSWALRYQDDENSLPHTSHFAWQTEQRSVWRSATSDSTFDCRFDDGDSLLGISGLCIDKVIAIGPILPSMPTFNITEVPVSFWLDCIRCYLSWRQMVIQGKENTAQWHESLDAFIQIVWFESEYFNLEENFPDDETRELFVKFDKMITENFGFLLKNDCERGTSKAKKFAESFQALSTATGLMLKSFRGGEFFEVVEVYFAMIWPQRRRMVSTSCGRFGLAPIQTLSGDEIVLVAGSRAPFILRAVDDSKYRLVGDCCIHGLMEGEAWDGSQTVSLWLT